MGYASIGAYTASKWGVRGLTKSAALELGPFGIRVMSIHPGPIATPMTAGMGEHMTASQPIARFGTVEEVTRLMLFMASEATDSTGSAWVIDGGAVLGPIQELGSGRHSTDDVAVAASRVEAATGLGRVPTVYLRDGSSDLRRLRLEGGVHLEGPPSRCRDGTRLHDLQDMAGVFRRQDGCAALAD